MEDLNMIAADCVVISCCCQCLILQIIIFVLLKIPRKLVKKTRDYAKRKLRCRKSEGKVVMIGRRFGDEFMEFNEGSIRIEVEKFYGEHGCESCMEEVERVLEELSRKGEFAFGSFWGREMERSSGSSSKIVDYEHEFDLNVVQFELVEIVGSFRYIAKK